MSLILFIIFEKV